MATESTSFVQFDYCKLCKTSHKKKKKHIYSKRHQEILQNILKKFSKKVKDARSCLGNPTIEALGWENGSKFWCYFCESEVDRHRRETDATVKNGGLIAHIASDGHVKKTGEFFWKNIIDKNKKKDLIMSKVEAERFLNKSETALTLYRQKMNTRIQQMTEKIHKQTIEQQISKKNAVKAPPWEQMCTKQTQVSQQAAVGHVTSGPSLIGQTSGTFFKTVEAVAVGLTAIVRPKPKAGEKEVGNVFTGGTPPWLREDEEEEERGGDIGPSMSQYEKHLERERKKKLPANRVGANMDHSMQTSASWLPSFGGVWNKGRRLNSKIQFERRSGMRGVGHSSAASTSAMPNEPVTLVPYVRKKKHNSSNTGSGLSLISSPLVDERPTQMQGKVGPGLVSSSLIHSPLAQSTQGLMAPLDVVGQTDAGSLRIPQTRPLHQAESSVQPSLVRPFGHPVSPYGKTRVSSSRVPHLQTQATPHQALLEKGSRSNGSMHNESVQKEMSTANSLNSSLANSIPAMFETRSTKQAHVIDEVSDESNTDHRNITRSQAVQDNETQILEDSSIAKPESSNKVDASGNESVLLDTRNTTRPSLGTTQSLKNEDVASSRRRISSNSVNVVPYKRKKTQEIPANLSSSHVPPLTMNQRSQHSTSVNHRTVLETTSQSAVPRQPHVKQPAHQCNIPRTHSHVRSNQAHSLQGHHQFSGHPGPQSNYGQMTNQTFVHQQQQQHQNRFRGHHNQQGMQHYHQGHWLDTVHTRPQQFSAFTPRASTIPQHLLPSTQNAASRPHQFSSFVQNPVPSVYGQGQYGQNMYVPQPVTAYQAAQSAYSQQHQTHQQQETGVPQTQAQPPSGTGGLNLFNSISAAVGSKLPRT